MHPNYPPKKIIITPLKKFVNPNQPNSHYSLLIEDRDKLFWLEFKKATPKIVKNYEKLWLKHMCLGFPFNLSRNVCFFCLQLLKQISKFFGGVRRCWMVGRVFPINLKFFILFQETFRSGWLKNSDHIPANFLPLNKLYFNTRFFCLVSFFWTNFTDFCCFFLWSMILDFEEWKNTQRGEPHFSFFITFSFVFFNLWEK